MAALHAGRYSFTTPHGKTVGMIVGGSSIFLYLALVGVKKDVAHQERINPTAHRSDYSSTDAISVVHHPAKNANVKGAQPSASKFV